ncbi:MAG: hypothetical protein KF862_22675 [Chitinophagaceae bacterium]|nr:hypothetical protein [Chitinophagaceae bacterium]
MLIIKIARLLLVLIIYISISAPGFSQSKRTYTKGELYFSWGYNTEWYTRSNVHVKQPELGNKYSFNHIKGHDRRGWDNRLFKKPLTNPQYNYRLGYFFNPEKGWGFEINFDHTKFVFQDGQDVSLTGQLDGKPVDTTIHFSKENGFFYYLNNGANFLLFNIVKRHELYTSRNQKLKIDFLGKAGIGPVIPHVENSFFGNKNKPHFQLGGWNAGVEASLRATFLKYGYLEYANKLDYARYSHLKIYKGTAKHAFGTYEMILSIGGHIPIGKPLVHAQKS